MGFRGNLASMSLADIFQNLAANSQDGMLDVERAGAHRYVRFGGGLVVDAAREHRGAGLRPLAGYLVGRCLINEEQAEYAIRRSADTGGNLARVIPELGYASEEDINRLVSKYVEEEVYDLFTWESGDFEFSDGQPPEGVFGPEASSAGVRLPTGGLVMEAARRIDEWGRIRSTLPSGKEVFIAAEAAEERAEELDPVHRRVFGLADGTRDIDDLVADSYLSRFEVGGVLCSFLEGGLLRGAETRDLEEAAQELITRRRPERAVKVYERLLALGQDSEELRRRLAETALQAEDPGRAVIHLGVIADREIEAGRAEKAAEVWQEMLEAMPGNTRALQGLAEHYKRKNRSKEALKYYTDLSRAHSKLGSADRAVAAARAGLELSEKSFELRSLLAEALLAADRKMDAADEYERLGDQYLTDHRSRAATEAYRKALQIDHGRKHAKSQLTAIMADEAARKRARGRMIVGAVIFLIVAGVVGLIGAYEYAVAKPRFERARSFAEERTRKGAALFKARKFDAAIDAYGEARDALLQVEHLISLHRYELEAQDLRSNIELSIAQIESEKAKIEDEVARRSERIEKDADTLIAQGDLEGARAKLQELMASGSDNYKRAARKRLKQIDKCLEEIRSVVSRATSVVDERKWFVDAMKLVRKYPNHPEVRKLTVRVKIESDPAGALVSHPQGPATPTPCAMRFPVAGATQLTFKRKGYKDRTISVEARDVPGSQTISEKLDRVHLWSVRVGIQVEAPIVIAGDTALFGDRGGNVWALEARTGKERWRRQLGRLSAVTGAVEVSEGALFVPSLDRKVHALSLATGKQLFKPAPTGGLVRAGPRVARVRLLNNQRFLFFGAEDGHVYCVGAREGKQRWKSAAIGPVLGSVLPTDKAVFVGSDDEHLRALNPTNGKELWKLKLGSAVRSTPVLSEDRKRVYVGADNGALYAVDIAARRVAWMFKAKSGIRSGPVLYSGRLFFGTSGGVVHAVRPRARSAEPIWEQKVGGVITAAPLVTQNRVYVGSQSGDFLSLDRGNDGSVVWRYRTGGRVRSSAAWYKGLVLFGSDDGYLYAFDERN